MRFGTKPLSSLRPKPIVSKPSPIPKHLTAIKKLHLTKSQTPSRSKLSTTTTVQHNTRPQSARVPRQRRSVPTNKTPVPGHLRPYLTAIPTKEALKRQKMNRKRRRKQQHAKRTWSSSKQNHSIQKYLSLSQSHWNAITASGLHTTSTKTSLYGKDFLTATEALQLQLAKSLNSLSNNELNQAARTGGTTVAAKVDNTIVEHAWKMLKQKIKQHCFNSENEEHEEYEKMICTRKRDQLLTMLGMFYDRMPSTEIIFEAHSAARRAIHCSAFVLQRWWRNIHGVVRVQVVDDEEEEEWENEEEDEKEGEGEGEGEEKKKNGNARTRPWLWHDTKQLARRRRRLRKRRDREQQLDRHPSSSSSSSIPKESWNDRYALRDNRTKPTGRYVEPGGGRFSTAYPKSDVDWTILRSQEVPGPGRYNPKMLPSILGAAKISEANPKSYLDWEVYRSKEIPGPSAYDISLCR